MSADIKRDFYLYNTLTRRKELLKTITPGRVGLYVCGPTVYGDPHLGHARPGVTFDVLVRLLKNIGYKVRYVRNITDVGHLEHDADEGEDKIAKKARLEELEPMEVAQLYTVHFRQAMAKLNVRPPSIEPNASGHIIEQIEFIKKILDNGYAYVSNGSVYFDADVDAITPAGLMNFVKKDGFAWYDIDHIERQNRKINADGKGWLAFTNGDWILKKKFQDLNPSEPAPEEAEIQVYVNQGDSYVELESQGAYTNLKPGEKLDWAVRWYLTKK